MQQNKVTKLIPRQQQKLPNSQYIWLTHQQPHQLNTDISITIIAPNKDDNPNLVIQSKNPDITINEKTSEALPELELHAQAIGSCIKNNTTHYLTEVTVKQHKRPRQWRKAKLLKKESPDTI